MNELYITDLIDPSTLKKVQDAFSNMFHMAALTTDADGHPVTEDSNFALYCQRYKKRSEAGRKKCEECFLKAALATKEAGKPCTFTCHSGLVYFAAPIMVDGKIIGSFVGGQVLTDSPDPERIRIAAEVIDADFDEFYSYAKDIPVVSEESIANAAGFLFNMAEVLSDMCYAKYQSIQANIEIEKASRMRTDFLANMSHEIRTPMNAVISMAEMALREDIPDSARNYISQIKSSGRALLAIINDILDFSKIEAGKMEIDPVDYDLSSVINDLVNVVQIRADEKGLKISLDIDPKTPKRLYGDEIRIKQVITNMLTNAVKYTEKGTVTFRIGYEKTEEDDRIDLKVAVEDTGIGIKPEDISRLYELFDRIEEKRNRNIEGTGLGMNITQRLLEMMGSEMNVESTYGEGSKFSFVLRQKVTKWEELGDYEKAYERLAGERRDYHEKFIAPEAEVLAIDDNPMNLMVFKNLLKKTKVKIDTANDGYEGLKYAQDKKYDLIFFDHMMPGKDGLETLHKMKEQKDNPNLDTPCICLTANAISGAREYYLDAGFDEYLTKPVDSSRLEEMMCRFLPSEKIVSASENRSAVILSFRHSVLVKDLERRLVRLNYSVRVYEKNLKNITEKNVGNAGVFLLYVFDDTVWDTEKKDALKYVCKVLAEKHQKAVIIGREKYRESLCSDIPDLVKFEWIDSPADNDVLEAL